MPVLKIRETASPEKSRAELNTDSQDPIDRLTKISNEALSRPDHSSNSCSMDTNDVADANDVPAFMPANSLSGMPPEILTHIFSQLFNPHDPKQLIPALLAPKLTSRRHFEVANVVQADYINLNKIKLYELGLKTKEQAIAFACRLQDHIKHLDLSRFCINDDELGLIAQMST